MGTGICGQGWLDFSSRPDEKVSLLAAAWGCLHAHDMKLGRGEGGAHVMPALLSLKNPSMERL